MRSDRLEFSKQPLENGMTLWQHDMDVPFMQLSIIVPVGATSTVPEAPPEQQYGLAHLLEHMCLKRSKQHPELDEFSKLLTDVGGRWNAWTHDFHTEFFLTLPTTAVTSKLVRGFLSQVFAPIFIVDDLEKEKAVIREEAAAYNFYPGENSVSQYKFTEWMQLTAAPHKQIFGTTESLAALTIDNLEALHQYYQSTQTQIFLGGNIDFQELQTLLETVTTTDDIPPAEANAPDWVNSTYRAVPSSELQTSVLSWGGIFTSVTLEEYWGVCFLINLLTDSEYGALNQWLRYENSWSYGVSGFQTVQHDRLAWIIDMPIQSRQTADAVRQALPERLASIMNDANLLERSKQIERGRLCYDYQTLTERVDTAIDTVTTFGDVFTETAFINWLEQLRPATLLPTYSKYFNPETTSTLLMVPSNYR